MLYTNGDIASIDLQILRNFFVPPFKVERGRRIIFHILIRSKASKSTTKTKNFVLNIYHEIFASLLEMPRKPLINTSITYQQCQTTGPRPQPWASSLSSQTSGPASRLRRDDDELSTLTQTRSSPSTIGSQATATSSSREDWSRRLLLAIGLSIGSRRKWSAREGRGVRLVELW